MLEIEDSMTEMEKTTGRRMLVGRVVSDKMDKTVTVEVTRRVKHPKFRKYINRSKNYKAHDENNEFKVDDLVEIRESRPLSRTKRWTVVGRRSE
jgi:small subunit ribosomal protein S17